MAVFTYPNCACCGGSSRSSARSGQSSGLASSLRPSSGSSGASGRSSSASSVAACCDLPDKLCAYVLLSPSSGGSAAPSSGIFPLGSSGSSAASSAAPSSAAPSSASPVPVRVCLRRTGAQQWDGASTGGGTAIFLSMTCAGGIYSLSANGSAASPATGQDCAAVVFNFASAVGSVQVLRDDGTCCADSSSSSGSPGSVVPLGGSSSGRSGAGGDIPTNCCPSGISQTLFASLGSGEGSMMLNWNAGAGEWRGSKALGCGQTLYLAYRTDCQLYYSCDGASYQICTNFFPGGYTCGPPFIDGNGWFAAMSNTLAGCPSSPPCTPISVSITS